MVYDGFNEFLWKLFNGCQSLSKLFPGSIFSTVAKLLCRQDTTFDFHKLDVPIPFRGIDGENHLRRTPLIRYNWILLPDPIMRKTAKMSIQEGTVSDSRGYNRRLKRVQLALFLISALAFTALTGCNEPVQSVAQTPEKAQNEPNIATKPLTRIALGSCAHQDKDHPIWKPIVAAKPELFIFMGDNVYADTENMDEMRAIYRKLHRKPGYQELMKTCPILAVWDDHDYGLNDAGKEYKMKVESEAIFHQFFQTPPGSEALSRPGIYQTRYFGGQGNRLQIILLDTRYFRDPLVKLPTRSPDGPYGENADPNSTILGDAQWKWLEEQLAAPADFRIIVTSIQFLPRDHHWERWENFPHQRVRLLKLLKEHINNPVLFVSGDRHMGEIMEMKTSDPLSPGFSIYEMTSSGLTNAGGGRKGEPNRYRLSPTNFQSRNFGLISIDWEKKSAHLELRDVSGKTVDSFGFDF